jgi:hypothetical protein
MRELKEWLDKCEDNEFFEISKDTFFDDGDYELCSYDYNRDKESYQKICTQLNELLLMLRDGTLTVLT